MVNISPIIAHINIRLDFPVRFVGKKGCRGYQITMPYFLFQHGINVILCRQTKGERMFPGPVIEGFEPHVLQQTGEFPNGCGRLFVLVDARRALQGKIGIGLIALPNHQADGTCA